MDGYRAAARSLARPATARMVSGRTSRRPVKRCRVRHHLISAMACSAGVGLGGWGLRGVLWGGLSSGGGVFFCFSGDALGGLGLAGRFVGGHLLGWCVLLRFQRWGDDLVGVIFGQAAIAGVDEELDVGVFVDQIVDAFGAYGGLVVLSAWADRAGPQ